MTSAETRALHNTRSCVGTVSASCRTAKVFMSDNTLESAVTVQSRSFVRFGDANMKITLVVPL